jgi:hypothetical protein
MTTLKKLEQLESEITAKVQNLDLKMALMEQKLDLIATNHLAHIQKDLDWVKTVLWAGAGAVILQLLGIIAVLIK